MCIYCPPPFTKAGGIKTHSSVGPSLCPSVRPSVTKTLTLLISSEVLMIEHWYFSCMILVTSPFNWHHDATLTLTFLPTSRSKLLPGGGPQFSEFACIIIYVFIYNSLFYLFIGRFKRVQALQSHLTKKKVNIRSFLTPPSSRRITFGLTTNIYLFIYLFIYL